MLAEKSYSGIGSCLLEDGVMLPDGHSICLDVKPVHVKSAMVVSA